MYHSAKYITTEGSIPYYGKLQWEQVRYKSVSSTVVSVCVYIYVYIYMVRKGISNLLGFLCLPLSNTKSISKEYAETK